MASGCAVGEALGRAGLVGHPSDGYGGATLAVTLPDLRARVAITRARGEPGIAPADAAPLVAAAIARFARERPGFHPAVDVRCETTIPREVGLGGSSALVVATLRALGALAGEPIPETDLPALALAVETDDLGITAGPQDRVVQTLGGLVFMDFASGRHRRLDATLLPALFVAWRPGAGTSSGAAHSGVRNRHRDGDPAIRTAMRTLATLARDATAALEASDHDAFAGALTAGYEIRERIFDLDPRHTAMIGRARALKLPATYTGSGGAIVGVATDHAAVDRLRRDFDADGIRLTVYRPDQLRSSGSGSTG